MRSPLGLIVLILFTAGITSWETFSIRKAAAAPFYEADSLPALSKEAASAYSAGLMSEKRREFKDALRQYNSALQILHECTCQSVSSSLKANILLTRGKLFLHLSQYDDASEDLLLAASAFEALAAWEGQAFAWASLGEVGRWSGDFQAATRYKKLALLIYRQQGTLLQQVDMLGSLVELNSIADTGEVGRNEASRYIEEGLSLLSKHAAPLSFRDVTASLYAAKGLFQEQRRETLVQAIYEKDRDVLQRSLWRGIEYASAYFDIGVLGGEIEFTEGEWRKALPKLNASYLATAGNFYQRIGIANLLGRNDPVKAIFWFRSAALYHSSAALQREGTFELGKDWYYLGESYRQNKDFPNARVNFFRALLLGSVLQTPEIHWVYGGLGRTFADEDRLAEAIGYYSAGLTNLQALLRQVHVENTKGDVIAGALGSYHRLISLFLEQYRRTKEIRYLEESFAANESLRAQGFLDLVVRSRATLLGADSAEAEKVRLEISELRKALEDEKHGTAGESFLLKRLQTARDSWLKYQEVTTHNNPQAARLLTSKSSGLTEIQSILDQETVLLEFAFDGSKLVLWAVTKGDVAVYEQAVSYDELALLDEFLSILRQPLFGKEDVALYRSHARALYKKLLGPAQALLKDKAHLLIVPDGKLHYLPFETLVISNREENKQLTPSPLSDLDYLIKTFRITYAPSGSIVVELHRDREIRSRTPKLPLVAFGDPVYEPKIKNARGINAQVGGWSRLEYAKEEVYRIATMWGVPTVSPHVNMQRQASLQRVREIDFSQYRMVHFATHAAIADTFTHTNQPALVLSNGHSDGEDNDGLLRFRDIVNLKLNADLVVLSACRTNLGELKGGEGLIGLSRAFFYAGAASLVVSLWDVQDQSTSLLMEHFYRGLKEGLSRAEALRQAKLSLMTSTTKLKATGKDTGLASPFFWAPFILVGSADNKTGDAF